MFVFLLHHVIWRPEAGNEEEARRAAPAAVRSPNRNGETHKKGKRNGMRSGRITTPNAAAQQGAAAGAQQLAFTQSQHKQARLGNGTTKEAKPLREDGGTTVATLVGLVVCARPAHACAQTRERQRTRPMQVQRKDVSVVAAVVVRCACTTTAARRRVVLPTTVGYATARRPGESTPHNPPLASLLSRDAARASGSWLAPPISIAPRKPRGMTRR